MHALNQREECHPVVSCCLSIRLLALLALPMILLCLSLPAPSSAWELSVSLVVSRPTGASKLLQPNFTSCTDCQQRKVQSATGYVEAVQAQTRPAASFSAEDFQKVVIAAVPTSEPKRLAWFVMAIAKDPARRRLMKIAEAHPFDRALIAIDGRPVDINLLATWGSGLRLRFFRRKEAAERFAHGLGLPVEVEPSPKAGG